jgi:hypothetical protein
MEIRVSNHIWSVEKNCGPLRFKMSHYRKAVIRARAPSKAMGRPARLYLVCDNSFQTRSILDSNPFPFEVSLN